MSAFLVHLMRHGAPATPGLLLGHRDDPALPGGTAQCVAQAQSLAFDHVVSSDLTRAFAPARQIAASRTIPYDVDRRWRELDFGTWTGLAPESLDPAAYGRFCDDPQRHPPPDGERWADLRTRVADAFSALATHTIVLTHGGAMRAALSALFGMEQRQVWAFDLPYACVLTLKVWPDHAEPMAQIIGLATAP